VCAARPNGLLPFKVFALYGSEDRIQAFSTKNGLVFGLGWSFANDNPPGTGANADRSLANLSCYRWQKHCRGLYQTPIAA
jgi:hypothetical protein